MKVLFYDPLNTQNNFYVFVKQLRDAGIDADLAIGHDLPMGHSPNWQDTTIDDTAEPSWIKCIESPTLLNKPSTLIKNWLSVYRLAKQYDLIICSGMTPIWIANTGVPFVFMSYGSDLDQIAINGWSGMPSRDFDLVEKIVHLVTKTAQARSIRKAKCGIVAPYQAGLAKKLGMNNLHFLPHIIDTEMFCPNSMARNELHARFSCELLLFHPARQVWKDRTVADCKGNDIVIRTFAKFTNAWQGNAKLLMVNKGWDLDSSKQLVHQLGLQDKVIWIDPVTKPEMAKLYQGSDIVLDQFGIGILALVAVEAMACSIPVISHIGPEVGYKIRPPIIDCTSENSIVARLCRLANSQELRQSVGMAGRNWVERHCSPSTATKEYARFIRSFGA